MYGSEKVKICPGNVYIAKWQIQGDNDILTSINMSFRSEGAILISLFQRKHNIRHSVRHLPIII